MNSYKRKLMNVPNVIVGLWLLGMFTIYPLIYHNFYYNILQVKYATVLVLTLLMISAFIFICGFSGGFSNFFDDITNKGFKKWFAEEFSVWDICIMIYILITVISFQ